MPNEGRPPAQHVQPDSPSDGGDDSDGHDDDLDDRNEIEAAIGRTGGVIGGLLARLGLNNGAGRYARFQAHRAGAGSGVSYGKVLFLPAERAH